GIAWGILNRRFSTQAPGEKVRRFRDGRRGGTVEPVSETAIHTRLMVVVLAIPAWVMAQSGGAGDVGLLAPPPSVYVDASGPTVVQPEQGNTGGVNLDFSFRYLTDYVYRGIDFNEIGGKEDAANA